MNTSLLLAVVFTKILVFSLNPEIDVGQVEGGFVFCMGYWMSEKQYYDQETGEELSNGTWVRVICKTHLYTIC